MSILRWDPLDDFTSIRREMSRFVNEASPMRWTRMVRGESVMRLPLDAYVTEEEIVITAPVPGLDPENVEITMEDDTLTIKGELNRPLENVEYLFQERPYGPFSRSVKINVPIEVDQAEAKFDNGVLTLILPKSKETRAKVIKINAK
ncbi:MAG: Hsp20/alpha crystallin family protein [Anaerolineae bacterium]|nr:Hsp20/alpha crystallin family protein [Anaerolineae bacterium]